MLSLVLRTDRPEAECWLYEGNRQLDYYAWQAHRKLAETLHQTIHKALAANNYSLHDLSGIVIFAGPGSFTGLRIGVSVANTLAYSLKIPIIGQATLNGEVDWVKTGLDKLQQDEDDKQVVPLYGAAVKTTLPRK